MFAKNYPWHPFSLGVNLRAKRSILVLLNLIVLMQLSKWNTSSCERSNESAASSGKQKPSKAVHGKRYLADYGTMANQFQMSHIQFYPPE
jgi:hypothetical protein